MDTLSITAGIAGILSATLCVSLTLREFLHGVEEARTVIKAMIADVKALRKVLETMELTFEDMDAERLEIGNIGTHWRNLLKSLEDGKNCLLSLERLLEDTIKEVKFKFQDVMLEVQYLPGCSTKPHTSPPLDIQQL